jgi:molybdate transport system substrate-binding protein
MARKMSEGAVARDTSTTSQSAELVVFCAGAVQSVVRTLVSAYELRSGNTIKLESGTAGAVAQRVAEGAAGDVVIATAAGLAGLATAGKVEGTSIRDLGSLGVGMAVRAGAPKPDIHDVESFRNSLLAAQSTAYGDPVRGGQSGIHIAKVLAGLGIDKQLGSRLQIRDTGRDGFMDVAKGDIEIGLGPISEILANKDVALVGPFPAEIQSGVTFSAAVLSAAKNRHQAEEFVRHLTAPAARDKFEAMGFKVN